MAAPVAPAPAETTPAARASIAARTLRTDRWWQPPLISFSVLSAFVIYSTWAAFVNGDYFYKPYISPFYSPCLANVCGGNVKHHIHGANGVPHLSWVGPWWAISPAIIILVVPLGFRLTCYYYRRAYYRSFWLSPPACAVAEPHKRYSGETRFPLVLNNVHRYFFYLATILNVILTYDAIYALVAKHTHGVFGVGNAVLLINAGLLWAYTLSCHSCRHIMGGRLKHFSRHPVRFWMWGVASKLNQRHMQIAWASLVWVAVADLYVRLAASGSLGHGSWI